MHSNPTCYYRLALARCSSPACPSNRFSGFRERSKPLKRLHLIDLRDTSLKRGVNENGHFDAADSFCACCFAGVGRTTVARNDAFLRRK